MSEGMTSVAWPLTDAEMEVGTRLGAELGDGAESVYVVFHALTAAANAAFAVSHDRRDLAITLLEVLANLERMDGSRDWTAEPARQYVQAAMGLCAVAFTAAGAVAWLVGHGAEVTA